MTILKLLQTGELDADYAADLEKIVSQSTPKQVNTNAPTSGAVTSQSTPSDPKNKPPVSDPQSGSGAPPPPSGNGGANPNPPGAPGGSGTNPLDDERKKFFEIMSIKKITFLSILPLVHFEQFPL